MIHELTDFVIGYIDGFTMARPHEAQHAEARTRTSSARKREEELEQILTDPAINPDDARPMLDEMNLRLKALNEIDEQWDKYLDEINKLDELVDRVRGSIPILKGVRVNARNQVEVLQEAAMLRILQSTSSTIRGTVNAVQALRLAPLTSDRVRALIGSSING